MSAALSHQDTESTTGDKTTSSTQQRFTAIMEMNTRFSTKLSMKARLGFDVIYRKDSSESTELQPNLTLGFSTDSVQLNTGYRQILRDSTTVSGATTSTRTSETTEAYADASIRAGRLPDIRLRYLTRDQVEEDSAGAVVDNTGNDFSGSMNYRLGIFNLNADYSARNNVDNITGVENDNVQVSGQLLVSKRFSSKVNVSLRENYLLSENTQSDGPEVTKTASVSEAKLNLNPVERSALNMGYIFRLQQDENREAAGTTDNELEERQWFTSASYALPKFLRFYGSYSNRESNTTSDSSASLVFKTAEATAEVTTLGLNFKHSFGKFGIVSRYERRISENDSSSTDSGVTTVSGSESTRDNIDWLITANMSRFLRLAVSEAYVSETNNAGSNENNRFRIKADFGPVLNFVLSPYVDYSVSVTSQNSSPSRKTTTTETVVPVVYRANFGEKVQFDFRDDYRTRTVENETGQTKNSSNNAVFRLAIPRLTKSLSLSGDAAFNTSETDTTSTSSSTYTFRMAWSVSPHRLAANFRYQTGKGRPSTTDIGLQYGLSLKMKKISLSFNGTYSYTVTSGANVEESTGQKIYLTLSLRN